MGQTYTLECSQNDEVQLPILSFHTIIKNVTGEHITWTEEGIPIVLKTHSKDKWKSFSSITNLTSNIYGIRQTTPNLKREVTKVAKTFISEGCIKFDLVSNSSYTQHKLR